MSAALAKLHIAKKDLRLHDDDYRATLERLTGQTSAKGLTEAQIGVVLDELKARGWKPKAVQGGRKTAGKPAPAQHPTALKARALWISLWQLGAVRDRSEAALEAFARRQLRCERLVWADQQQMYKLIEALKAMAEREGWCQDVSGVDGTDGQVYLLKRRLIEAQCKKLSRPAPLRLDSFKTEHLDELAAGYAKIIREAD